MGNYLNKDYTQQDVESLAKDITWEINLYLNRDGLKYYSQFSEKEKELLNLKSNLIELVVILRLDGYNFNKNTVDELKLIFNECRETSSDQQFLDDYNLKSNLDKLSSYFNF